MVLKFEYNDIKIFVEWEIEKCPNRKYIKLKGPISIPRSKFTLYSESRSAFKCHNIFKMFLAANAAAA